MRTPDDIHDEWLVLRCQAGDDAALSELVERWQPRLLRHAIRLTGPVDAAGDVVQAAWVAILRGISKLDDPACFRRWAYRIVGNKSADWVRARQQERTKSEPLTQDPSDLRESDDQSSNEHEEIAALRRALKQLPTDQRAILSLYYLDDLPLVEIAQAVGIPLGTVKSRLHYARIALKEILERSKS